jgi:signal transduction histidine kinase
VISVRDITERSLHRFQDDFLALASHELIMPLTLLRANLHMLDKLFADDPDHAHARGLIARSQDQVRRLGRLIQDLLDVQRLQHGGFNLHVTHVSLAEVLARSAEEARLVAPAGHSIDVEIAEASPLMVNADVMRLEQVLMNRLTNAIAYAPHAPRIIVRLQRERHAAVIQVRNEGSHPVTPPCPTDVRGGAATRVRHPAAQRRHSPRR